MKKIAHSKRVSSSFRDPSGFIFYNHRQILRQINLFYKENYDYLVKSGLYKTLVEQRLLIPHREASLEYSQSDEAYKIIEPERVPFISYPYEWSFSQLKDAALTTIQIQKMALKHKMILKDASAYNVQFIHGKPVLIDSLSFEKYREGKPWVAYRQFCQHFLAPLALMAYKDVRLSQLLRVYIDGIPLDLASKLLPFKTRLNFSLLSHLHLHAKSQQHFADKRGAVKKLKIGVGRQALLSLVDNLEKTIKNSKLKKQDTEWSDYYNFTNYSQKAFDHKKKIVKSFLKKTKSRVVWDLGANIGEFSRLASQRKILTIAFDIDPVAVERNYLKVKKNEETHLLPLLLDLTNPSPGLGWSSRERKSLIERGPADIVLALALIHHLAISNNLPFNKIAHFFSKICHWLIIEFVPKSDSQIQKLLVTREDIFETYDRGSFEREFRKYFDVKEKKEVRDSSRTLYLMKRRKKEL